MTRCWMLTFWGKPRNKQIYRARARQPIMFMPLRWRWRLRVSRRRAIFLYVKEMIVASEKETQAIVGSAKFDPFQTAWHVEGAENLPARRGETERVPDGATDGTGRPPQSEFLKAGDKTMRSYAGFAWLIGIGIGFLVYLNGYWIAGPLMRIPPLNWIRIWLYRRMYFDELYFSVFVAIVLAFSAMAAAFDRYVVDGIVNLVGWGVKQLSIGVGMNEKYVVDGAVNGAADLAQGFGAAVRAPQTGRIRMYVTVLMIVVTLGVAGAIIVMMSR